MANEEHVRILKEGVEVWNRFVAKQEAKFCANLRGANLRGAYLDGAILRDADLRNANLFDANLTLTKLAGANLLGANLRNANLFGANLTSANLLGANLIDASAANANLRNANLTTANLIGAKLADANLTECRLGYTLFVDVDLSKVIGLSTAIHEVASAVGTNTLSRSEGKIPDSFLKGCGLTDWEVLNARLYDPDLTEEEFLDIHYEVYRLKREGPIQVNPVFLSYSHQDSTFVDKLQAALDAKGVRSWRDKTHAEVGPLEGVIDRAIRLNPTVLLVLSENSVRSGWVKWEIQKATKLEQELGRDVLCPVAIDDAWLTKLRPDLRSEVERYAVLDLSGDGAIEREMSRILRGLQIFYRDSERPS